MLTQLDGAIELGLLYALMALGVYITFRILDFPDLTVDGSFTTGGAIAAIMITNGFSPWLATLAAFAGGCAAGAITGLLHTKGRINGLLSGILMMIALYSINMRILAKPNVSLISSDTVFTSISPIALMLIVVIVIKLALDAFLKTDLGLALRATGDNARMIGSFGANTDTTKIIGVSLSNGLVALSGGFIAAQIWKRDSDGNLMMAQELPIHQIYDLMILLSKTLLYCKEAYRLPLLYDPDMPAVGRIEVQGGVLPIEVCTDNPNIHKDIQAIVQSLSDLGELIGERQRVLGRIIDELEDY